MERACRVRPSERGAALIMALLVLLLLSMLGGALLTSATVDWRIADNYQSANQLLYVAEAGIEDGRELLRHAAIVPSSSPLLERRPLIDVSGREAGRYSVFVTRSNPVTLRSVGIIGRSMKTVESRLVKAGFPRLRQGVTLAENLVAESPEDPSLRSLRTPAGLERLVRGISRNAMEVYGSPSGSVRLMPIGSRSRYRVVVVDGDCALGDLSGFGLLLVRGELLLHGNFSWNGVILVIGRGTLRAAPDSNGWIQGGLFVARTLDGIPSERSLFGEISDALEPSTLALGAGRLAVTFDAEEWDRANESFPLIPVSYREY